MSIATKAFFSKQQHFLKDTTHNMQLISIIMNGYQWLQGTVL